MLQERNYKRIAVILMTLCSLCLTPAQGAASKHIISVSGTKQVEFSTSGVSRPETHNLYNWNELAGLMADGWRVLTKDEWSYIFNERTNHNALYGQGKVNGINGLILLPDEWQPPTGLTFTPLWSTDKGYDLNVYTSAQWTDMENAGAVFLPCGGYGVYEDGEFQWYDGTIHGSYWSCTEYEYATEKAYRVVFDDDDIPVINEESVMPKDRYYSVFLVRDNAPVLDEEDEKEDFEAKLEVARQNSYAVLHRTIGKNGTFYTMCLPFDVPKISESPLAGAEVFTFDGGTVTGSAGSEVLHLDLIALTTDKLLQGVPYLMRWEDTGETVTDMVFDHVENWAATSTAGEDVGDEIVKCHGFFHRTHISGSSDPHAAHYNFFMGANNTIYWPNDGEDPNAKIKGFRAHFYIIPGGSPSELTVSQGMTTLLNIGGGFTIGLTPTDIQNTEYQTIVRKALKEGRVVLIIDGEQYTIGGQKL